MRYGLVVSVVWTVVIGGSFALAVLDGIVRLDASVTAVLVLCFACELLDSSLGMGYGTTLTPVLLMAGFDASQLVPTILVSEFFSGFASFFFHSQAGNIRLRRESRHVRTGLLLALFSVAGVAAGVHIALNISKTALNRLISLVILGAGLTILLAGRRTFAYRAWKLALLGLVASFNKAISGGGYGPLMTSGQVLSGVESRAAVGITSFAEGFTCLAAGTLFLVLGDPLEPQLLVPVVTGALLSVPIAAGIVSVTHEKLLRNVIGAATVALGLLALGRTLF